MQLVEVIEQLCAVTLLAVLISAQGWSESTKFIVLFQAADIHSFLL